MKPERQACVLGVDIGTSSVRAVVLDAAGGEQIATAEAGFGAGMPAITAMLQAHHHRCG